MLRKIFFAYSSCPWDFPWCSFVVEMLVFLCGLCVLCGERVLVVALLRCVSKVLGFALNPLKDEFLGKASLEVRIQVLWLEIFSNQLQRLFLHLKIRAKA